MFRKVKLGIVGILIAIVCQSIVVPYTNGATLDTDGGYNIVIGIESDRPKPDTVDVKTYVNNIKETLQSLSTGIFTSTEDRFYIKSVQLVLPASWQYEGASTTLKSYNTADIRISKSNLVPQTDNPNLCGLPGNSIQLPLSFFEGPKNSGPYGPPRKALLNLFARLRWGVWEEHGYPGDERFPYFYKANNNLGTPWTVTGCSNVPLNGTFQRMNGTPCNATDDNPLDVNCRFVPDRVNNQNARSSIMSFQWLESVENFCDETSNNQDIPNKQNLFCDYKSSMETIRSSADALTVTAPLDHVPILSFKVTKPSTLPPLYVLIDQGSFNLAEVSMVTMALTEISKLFGQLPGETLVALGTFPTSDTVLGVHEIIPFTELSERDKDDFVTAIVGLGYLTNSTHRDFGLALQQCADAIKSLGHNNGGRILILKTGGATNSSTFSYEKEIALNLLKDNISVFAIEVTGANNERRNLVNLASLTAGRSEAISNFSDAQEKAAGIVKSIADSYQTNSTTLPNATDVPRITWRGEIIPGQNYTIPVIFGSETLSFFFITADKINVSTIRGGIDLGPLTYLATFNATNEYSSEENNLTRYMYSGALDTTILNVREVNFHVPNVSTAKGYLFVTSEGNNVPADITVEVITSAGNSVVDLGHVTNKNAPFAIFARIRQNGVAVAGANVQASLVLINGSIADQVNLYDNGAGAEDIGANDGIYSGVVVPSTDGSYVVSVTVSKGATGRSVIHTLPASSSQRLIPIDQNYGAPAEQAVELPGALYKTVNYNGIVSFTNRVDYKNVIPKVRDLIVSTGPGPFDLSFSHTSPKILGKSGSPKLYQYFAGETREALSNLNITNLALLPVGVTHLGNQTVDGTHPGVQISFVATSELSYFAVLSSPEADEESALSNIVEAIIEPTTADPSSSTTTADPNSSTTTDDPNSSTTAGSENTSSTDSATGVTGSTDPGNTTPDEGAGSSTEGGATTVAQDEDEPWLRTTGGIVTVVVVVLVFFAAAGAGLWYMKKKRTGNTGTTFSESP